MEAVIFFITRISLFILFWLVYLFLVEVAFEHKKISDVIRGFIHFLKGSVKEVGVDNGRG